jgi:hypothetical protein
LFQGRMLVLCSSRWLCSRAWTGNMINRSCDRLSYPRPENYMIGLESYLGSPISKFFATVASATNTWTHHHSIYKRLQDTQMQNLLNTLSKLHPLYSQNYNWNYEFASIILHCEISLIIRSKWDKWFTRCCSKLPIYSHTVEGLAGQGNNRSSRSASNCHLLSNFAQLRYSAWPAHQPAWASQIRYMCQLAASNLYANFCSLDIELHNDYNLTSSHWSALS